MDLNSSLDDSRRSVPQVSMPQESREVRSGGQGSHALFGQL